MKILKLLSFVKFYCASNDIFLKLLWSKLNFLQEKLRSIWTKISFSDVFLQFLELRAYSTTLFTSTAICNQRIVKISDKSHE